MTKKIILVSVLFTVFFQNGKAQDTLYLYTKQDCSVCKQTKQVLSARGITFVEKDLAVGAIGTEMLNKLAVSKFKSPIYLPVIYLGQKLFHPAFASQSGLVNIDINAAVDSIFHSFRNGLVAKINMPVSANQLKTEPTNTSGNCEHTSGELFLIVASYPNEKEALNAVQILLKNGYTKSGFIFEQAKFRVYVDVFTDFTLASAQLSEHKIRFTDAFLMQKNK